MSEAGFRLIVVGGLALLALVVAYGWRRWDRRRAARLDVSGLVSGPAVVVFTRDACPNCARVLDEVDRLGLTVRQIQVEAEPDIFESLGVSGVPVTVFVDAAGRSRGQFGGVPGRRALTRAARRSREIPGSSLRAL